MWTSWILSKNPINFYSRPHSKNHLYYFLATRADLCVDLVTSMYFSGTRNVFLSAHRVELAVPWIDQKSFLASVSSFLFWFCRWKTFRFTMKFSAEIFDHYGWLLPWSGFSESMVFTQQFRCTICNWEYELFSLLWNQCFFCIESSKKIFRCIQLFQIFQICYRDKLIAKNTHEPKKKTHMNNTKKTHEQHKKHTWTTQKAHMKNTTKTHMNDVHSIVGCLVPILHINWSFLSEPDQPIDELDTAPIFETEVLDWFHKEPSQNFSLPTFLCPCPLQLQIIVSELRILLEQSSQLSARGRHANLSFQTKFAHFQDLDLFSNVGDVCHITPQQFPAAS